MTPPTPPKCEDGADEALRAGRIMWLKNWSELAASSHAYLMWHIDEECFGHPVILLSCTDEGGFVETLMVGVDYTFPGFICGVIVNRG